MRRAYLALLVIVVFFGTIVSQPSSNSVGLAPRSNPIHTGEYSLSDWDDMNTGTGLPISGIIHGSKVSSGTSTMDSTHPGYISTDTPAGWSSENLNAELEHLSQWVDVGLVNPNLDAYHNEHWFMTSNPEYNYDSFYVPDGWTFVKNDAIPSGTQHPEHGYFEINGISGAGYDSTMGWRFDANVDSGATLNPTNGFYISQQVPTPWRNVYSAEITFNYYVSSTSTLNNQVHVFTSLGGYVSKYHVFDLGTPMNTWLEASTTVPSSFFDTIQTMDSLLFDIGLGTDINGHPATANHEVFIDEISLRLNVRPFPEDVDLQVNGGQVTGSAKESVSPYVPDGTNRDCYSAPNSNGGSGGIDLNGYGDNGALEIGADVPSYPDWSDAFSYQVGLQFPLHVAQGAIVESAFLEVEAVTGSVGFPGMRIYVAYEDNVAAFTSGYPLLPDRYDWVNTSIYWKPTTWSANGRYKTPDLAVLIQEVVSRPGWQSGNYICIMIGYAYSNQQYAYNQIKGSSSYSQGDLARLFIDFSTPTSNDIIANLRYEKSITINHSKVASDLHDFPLLVDIWDENLRMRAQPDGDDIAFFSNGQFLSHDLDLFDKAGNGTHAHLVAWVRVPYISSAVDTQITMMYGDEQVRKLERPDDVWDLDFAGVWHMNNNPSQPQWSTTYSDYLPHAPQIIDRTSNNNDGTSYGSMTSGDLVIGQIGNAIDFDGSNDYVSAGDTSSLRVGRNDFSMSLWFSSTDLDSPLALKGAIGTAATRYMLSITNTGQIKAEIDDDSSTPGKISIYSPTGMNDGLWHHAAIIREGNLLHLYVDGVEVSGSPANITNYGNVDSVEPFLMAAYDNYDNGAPGSIDAYTATKLDEIHMSHFALTAQWIAAEFNNQHDASSFFSVGAESHSNTLGLYEFRKKISITTGPEPVPEGYSISATINHKALVAEGKSQANGDDIRVVYFNGQSWRDLDRVLDSDSSWNAADTKIWFRIQSTIPASSSDEYYYLYYGNPMATSPPNNHRKVFQFYDGFESGDLSAWNGSYTDLGDSLSVTTEEANSGVYSSKGSVDNQASAQAQVWTDFSDSTNLLARVHFYLPEDFSTSGHVTIMQFVDTSAGWANQLSVTIRDDMTFYLWNDIAGEAYGYGATSAISTGSWHTVEVQAKISAITGEARLWLDGNLEVQATGKNLGTNGIDRFCTVFYWADPQTEPNTVYADDVFLRPYVNPEPTVSLGPELNQTAEFNYRKDIVIDHTKVSTDLIDFPILINIFDRDLRTDVQSDGDDIMFRVGSTWVPHQIELFDQTYNSTHAHLTAWVKADLSSSVDTIITMYYGNPTMSSREDPTGVWRNYVGVWHLDESPTGTVYDSSPYNNDGVTLGSMTALDLVPCQIGNGFDLDGIDDMINVSESSSLDSINDAGTLSLWINWVDPSNGVHQRILTTSDRFILNPTPPPTYLQVDGLEWGVQDDGDNYFYPWGGDGNDYNLATNPFANNYWHYVVLTLDYSTKSVKIYLDGSLLTLSTENVPSHWTQLANLGDWLWGGNNVVADNQFLGKFDELRVSSMARSQGWILTEFNNQYDPDSFYVIGPEQQTVNNEYIFTTNSAHSLTLEAKMTLRVQTLTSSYSDDLTSGTTFNVANNSLPIWTANILVSPTSGLEAVSFEVSYPESDWFPISVTSPTGIEKSYLIDWTCFDGKLIVSEAAINEYGIWKLQFQDRNQVINIQMGLAGGPYHDSGKFAVGQDIEFRVWSSGIPSSSVVYDLTDPNGTTWYSGAASYEGARFALPYYCRKSIIIGHEKVEADLTDFPLLIDIYDQDLRSDVRPDGKDIAFAMGEKTLSFEIELFDQTYNLTHAHLIAWVKVPQLLSTQDTRIMMYYNNPVAPVVPNTGGVYDSGYLGVWHLSESGSGLPGEYTDSSQYRNDGQGGEGNSLYIPTRSSGKIGYAQYFTNATDGHYDLIDCGDSQLWDITGNQITLEAWVRHDVTPSTHVYGILNHKGWFDGYSLLMNYGGGSTLKPTFCLPGDTNQLVGANDVTAGSWHHIVAVYDGSLMRIYVDGIQDPNVMLKSDNIESSSGEKGLWIGHGDQPQDKSWSAEWLGYIDEVRVSSIGRSSSWIKTEYQNQDNPESFFSVGSEETAGYSSSASINLDSSAVEGIWHVTARYSDGGIDIMHSVGVFSRSFIVTHGASLSLTAPGDAVSDNVAARLVGEQLYIEYEMSDALNAEPVIGASITMNWSTSGTPANILLNDYGDGKYGKTLNTSDLGGYGRWRIELTTDHPFYAEASSFFDLDLSHRTFITYEPPMSSPYGDDFQLRLTLRDQFDGALLPGASLVSNGTIIGSPVDYGNGTYLVTLDSAGLPTGNYAFSISVTPSTTYLVSSQIDVHFTYRPIATNGYLLGPDRVDTPWDQQAVATLYWIDVDHSAAGIEGGSITIDPSVQTVTIDIGGGYYNLTINASSYSPGTYMFDLIISKANYQQTAVTLTIIVGAHRTSIDVDYVDVLPVGTDSSFNVTFIDVDLSPSEIGSDNLSRIVVDWTSGSQEFYGFSFVLDTSGWAVGIYTINLTVIATSTPRYYVDTYIIINLEIRRLNVFLSWNHLEPFPNGNDFVMYLHANVSEPGSSVDGAPIDWLGQSYFSATNQSGAPYSFKSFLNLGDGLYELTIDGAIFFEGEYNIIVHVNFLISENYSASHTPIVQFTYRPILTYLTSPDYPTVTTNYDTNVTVILSYVDIDHGLNITIGTIASQGASISWQHLANGVYEVLIIVQSWDLGTHEVNLTADATGFQAKTLTFQILVQIAYAYARSSISTIDLPVGDTAVFYADYFDITHATLILGATLTHDWIHSLSMSWTGSQYKIELPSLDTDSLGSYLVIFNFSKGSNYQFGYFNLTIILRTHSTEFRLASAVEPTSYNAMVNVSVYCGDLDNGIGIISSFISLSIHNETGQIPSTFENDTILGSGYFIIRLAASNLGVSGVYELIIHFNWTGSTQKFYNRTVKAFVNIVGEASELDLLESSGPTAYLGNMSYTYFYSELYSGIGISNSTPPVGNVFIYVRFPGELVDFSQLSIREVIGYPGKYTIEFNSTIFGKPGVYTMLVFVNWSRSMDPGYANRTDTVTLRIIPRSSVITVSPPESTPYGVNTTFTFSFDDVVNETPERIAFGPQMDITIGLPDYTLIYNSTTRQFYVSFNTSILGAPIGNRQFSISINWSGFPFYANVTGRTVTINIRFRDTEFDCTSINPTPYGNNITLKMTFSDVTLGISSPINDGVVTLYNGSQVVTAIYYQLTNIGNGEYELELNSTYFGSPGTYQLKMEISTSHFYYAFATATRTLSLRYRLTMLSAEPIGEAPFNSSLTVVFQYTDVLNYLQIGNGSTPTGMDILNGSSWSFTSSWRSVSEDYLLIIDTFNQNLEINKEYVLWLRISYPDVSPYYREAEAYVSFILRERTTFLDLLETPLPGPYLDYVNLTVFYGDMESSEGIAGAVITLSLYGSNLTEGNDYLLQRTSDGSYYISINTTSIGPAGTLASLTVSASWLTGAPYYTESVLTLTLSVTRRGASAEILTSPAPVMFLSNISFSFRYIDDTSEELILLAKNQVLIYSEGSLLQSDYFSMIFTGIGYEISINSTFLSSSLISNWNITIDMDWQDSMEPFYTDDQVSVLATVTNRAGLLIRYPVSTTPIGDNMSLTFSYVDGATGLGISSAIVVFDCLNPSGLIENTHFWVIRNDGDYTIFVDTNHLGHIGTYTFTLRLLWNPSLMPFYANSTTIQLQGSVRQVQASLESSEPTPSTVPINDSVSVILILNDLDHGVPITGAELSFLVSYKTNTSGPGTWSITAVGPGNYLLVVDCSDAGAIGTNTLIITISFSNYQTAEIQVPFQIRDRQGELNELPPSDTYCGETTSVVVQLVDTDAANAPVDGALLNLTWPGADMPQWSSLSNGWYRINITTIGLNSGLYSLVIAAHKSDYFIPDISVPIQILRIPTEIIMPDTLPDVYWGDEISFWGVFNNTHNGGFISGASVYYQFGTFNGLLPENLPAGNYSITLDTGNLALATSYIITITATLDNYATSTKQVTVNVLRIPLTLSVIGNVHPELFKGELLNITVYVNNTLYNVPLMGATITAKTTLGTLSLTLAPVAGMNGYYFGLVDTNILIVGDYVIAISASRDNYVPASTSLSVKIKQIPTVLYLDTLTSTYSSQTFNWSDTIRVGIYVLAPSLNVSYPYTTGLQDCRVMWSLSGTSFTGQFQNGTLIGGAGFFYFDFDTLIFEATTYTMRITAYPNVGMFAYSTNTTTLKINPIATSVDSPYLSAKVWGWAGWVNLTYWDVLHHSGVHYALAQVDWEGNETIYNYLGNGIYEVFINTSLVKPGIYPVSVNFQKDNHEAGTGVFTLSVKEVPTSIEVYATSVNQIEGSSLNLRVPYGDILPIILFYNDTWYCSGIPGATEMTAVIIGPSIPDKESLVIEEIAFGNYSLMFNSANWIVSSAPYRIIVSFSLGNWSRATINLDVTIINVPTSLRVVGDTSVIMNFGQLYTVWVFYNDTWEGHNGEGIPNGIVNATSLNTNFVIVYLNQSDPTRPGWYEIQLFSQRTQGSALISIEVTKENYDRAIVSVAVAVEPSDFDILIERVVIYGVPVGLILLGGAILWTRLFSIPKRLRHIRRMVNDVAKGNIPKPPDDTKSRQQIVAELFNEIGAGFGITRTAEQMPQAPLAMEIPEIEALLLQLSVLTKLTLDELDDFKVDLSKMKLSEQVNFVKEVINQEAIKRARSEKKTMEMVLEETAAQAHSLLAGEEPVTIAVPEEPEEFVEPAAFTEEEVAESIAVEVEEDILTDVLSEDEIEEIRKKLTIAGIGKNELKTIIDQVRELPRELVDELLKSVLGKGGEEK